MILVMSYLLPFVLAVVFFTITEVARQMTPWMWRWYPYNLLWWAAGTGLAISIANAGVYAIGDMFQVDLRPDPLSMDFMTEILLTFIICFFTWILIVVSLYMLKVVIPKAFEEQRRKRRPPKDPP